MSNIAIPNSFTAYTVAASAEVNANFTEIQTKFNTYAVQKDVAATITAIHTYSTAPVFGFATASQALELDASKNVQSVAITGTGNYVKSASPTFTGTVVAAALTLSGALNGQTISSAASFTGTLATAGAVTATSTSGEQFKAAYDGSNHATLTVGVSGVATFTATGAGASFVFSASITVNYATPTVALAVGGVIVSALTHVSSNLRINTETGQGTIDLATAGTTVRARVETSAAVRETFLSIYDADNAALERVSVGVADSGGSGYKLLRIPN